MSPITASRLALVSAAVLFSTGGAVIKLIELNAWQIASFRSGVAALAVMAFIPDARRLHRPRSWLVGFAFAVTMILFVAANKATTALNAIFLQSTAPIYVLVLGPWLLRERATGADIVFSFALGLGMAAFFLGQDGAATAPEPGLGNALAAASGLTWAGTVLGLRWLARDRLGTPAAVAAGSIIACLLALPFALTDVSLSPASIGWLVYLGVFQIGLAYVCLGRGLAELPAFEASLILLLEPVLSPIWAFLVHDERPSTWAMVGAGIILVATAAKPLIGGSRRVLGAARRAAPPREPPGLRGGSDSNSISGG